MHPPRRQTSPNHTEHTSLSPSPTKLVPVGGCPLFEELPHDASTQVRCPADVHTLCLKLDRTQDSLRKSCVLPRVALGCLCCTPIRATRRRLFAQMRSERNGRLSQRPLPPSFAPSQVREFVFDVKSAHCHTHLLLAHPASPSLSRYEPGRSSSSSLLTP